MKFDLNSRRRLALLLFLLVEVIAIGSMWTLTPQKRATRAFISKLRGEYILAWKDDLDAITVIHSASLDEILKYSQIDLGLHLARNMDSEGTLESVWITPRLGTFVVHWKSETEPQLNQMSFYNRSEADFFLKAFRSGSYTRSLLGHSILLVGSASP
ncbi:MAG: hypothetical protein HYR96_13210 [Deltaproteobacteria bacterium]|nr:hypothetical protein [Deltaproteobacteria bacterium]MBI3295042.1 hypothetical protein [Deltaproteobacteria bacterium]